MNILRVNWATIPTDGMNLKIIDNVVDSVTIMKISPYLFKGISIIKKSICEQSIDSKIS